MTPAWAVAALLALVGLAAPAAPAVAAPAAGDDTVVVRDSRTDVSSGVGISRLRIHNGSRLVVTTHHRDLRRIGYGDHFMVWVDTGRAHPGPDYVVAGGLSNGTDWATGRATSRWHPRIDPLDDIGTCASDLEICWVDDPARLTLGRACLGGYQGRVRVSVQAGDGRVTDHVPARHTFSRWVARG
jgi:hypothetical protein